MKIFWILIGVLVSPHSLSTSLEGMFNCKIERQTVWSIVDGKITVFSGYSDTPNNGEYIKFRYGIKDNRIFFTNDRFFYHSIFLDDAEQFGNDVQQVIKSSNSFDAMQFEDSSVYAGIPVSQLRLERYYKSDWHGLLTSVETPYEGADLSQWTVAMTCRHVTDRIDQVMQILSQSQD